MKKIGLVLLGAIMSMLVAGNAMAKDEYAIGMQGSMTSWGISGTYFIDSKKRAELVISNNTLAGRGLMVFKEHKSVDIYGVGELGLGFGVYDGVSFAAGVGAEFNWQDLIDDIFPLYWHLEAGVRMSTGNSYGFGGGFGPAIGGGWQYRF